MSIIYNFLKNSHPVYMSFNAKSGILSFSETKKGSSDICVQNKSEFIPAYRQILEKYIKKVKQDIYITVYVGNKDGSGDEKTDTIQFYKDWDTCQKDLANRTNFQRKCKADDISGYLSEFMSKDFSATKIEKQWFFAARRQKTNTLGVKETPKEDVEERFTVIHTGIRENLTLDDFVKPAERDRQLTLEDIPVEQPTPESRRGKKLVVNMNEPPAPAVKPEKVLTQKQKAEKGYCEAHGLNYEALPPWMNVEEYVASRSKKKPADEQTDKVTVQLTLSAEVLKHILQDYEIDDIEYLSESPLEEAENFFDRL